MPRAFVLLVCLLSCSAWAAGHGSPDDPKPGYLYGRVVGITDGDTVALLTPERRQVKVRLAEIDTPEKNQPYGSKSRQALADLVFQRDVAVQYVDTDRYGRTVGRIHAGDVDVNAELVRQGAAWVYRKYAKDRSLYALEDEARAQVVCRQMIVQFAQPLHVLEGRHPNERVTIRFNHPRHELDRSS